MPAVSDFRRRPFAIKNVRTSGDYVARAGYARLYLIENFLRVLIHSVLSAQIGPNWWDIAVEKTIHKDVERFKRQYVSRPWHNTPGPHDIYYTGLHHLSQVILSNRNHFDPVIPDVDQWIAEIERIRMPRNIVAHMNYPNMTDRKRIEVFYSDCKALFTSLQASRSVPLRIP